MAIKGEPNEFDEDAQYDEFPRGAEHGFGPDEGFNSWIQLNDARLFTPEAQSNPVIRAFLNAPYSVNYGRFKSSHRESEYFIHKPARAMTGQVEGIEGRVVNMPPDPQIATLLINHERSLAKRITHSVTIEDGKLAGQLVYKEAEEEDTGSW